MIKRLLVSLLALWMVLTPVLAKADANISESDISAVFNEQISGNEIAASVLSFEERRRQRGLLGGKYLHVRSVLQLVQLRVGLEWA